MQNEVSNMLVNNERVTFGEWMLRNVCFSEDGWREVTGINLNNRNQTIVFAISVWEKNVFL